MAQTITKMREAAVGTFAKAKIVRLKVANGASETSTAIDFSAYGLGVVLLYGYHAEDTYTATGGTYMTISGTTVTVTHANDVAAGVIWAIGY